MIIANIRLSTHHFTLLGFFYNSHHFQSCFFLSQEIFNLALI